MAYLVPLKAQIMKSLRSSFDSDFPDTDFAKIMIDQEYPIERTQYPSIWIDFDPTGPLIISGIGDEEFVTATIPGTLNSLYRWTFSGSVSFTCVALSNFERDRLLDSLITVMAFGRAAPQFNRFRQGIEGGQYIGINMNFDQIDQRGFAANPGTPWGTDEIVYEGTIAMDVIGEFTTTGSGVIMPLSGYQMFEFVIGQEPDPYPI